MVVNDLWEIYPHDSPIETTTVAQDTVYNCRIFICNLKHSYNKTFIYYSVLLLQSPPFVTFFIRTIEKPILYKIAKNLIVISNAFLL